MPRPRRPGAPEPKRRSRKGCWPCKARKVKCGEEKPACLNCQRQNEPCDYKLRLNWGGRTRRTPSANSPGSQSSGVSTHSFSFALSPSTSVQAHPAAPQSSGFDVSEDNAAHHEPVEFWDAGLTGERNIGRTYASRLHDIQSPAVPEQLLNSSHRTTDRAPVEMDLSRQQEMTIWPIQPAETSVHPHENDIPNDSSADPSAQAHYLSTTEITCTPPFLDFTFSSGLVSQPISFVRPAVGAREYVLDHSPSKQTDLLEPEGFLPSKTGGVNGVSDCTESSSSESNRALSPRSPGTSFFTSGTPRDNGESPGSFSGFLDGIPDNFGLGKIEHVRSDSFNTRLNPSRINQNDNSNLTNFEKWHAYLNSVTDNYGIDCGRPDMDLGINDDHSAIDVNVALGTVQSQSATDTPSPGKSQTGQEHHKSTARKYDYYAYSVSINIPRYLSPLPSSLLNAPINLMYFHHFLNHTARVLVPHDCGDNPFSSVLPSMALGDPNLLNLMLAYSASHRARFLGHPEPANRIAYWVSNVFPSLRVALENTEEKITDSHLATAIMLLSLKIVSPSTFEVPIPWQSHLNLARELFLARQSQIAYPGNRIGAFLTRWLGYLDIIGSLSCRHHQPPLLAYYSVLNTCSTDEDWDGFAVDCFTGFTPRTGLFLMNLGILVHQCDNERFDELGNFLPDWSPSLDTIRKAEELLSDWNMLDTHVHTLERHFQDSESSDMISVDRAFRHAGLLHLHRRVLGDSSTSVGVFKAIDGLMDSVMAIRSGSAVEAGVLFPIFTAGCETEDPGQRTEINKRLEMLERTGMKQIQSARALMQRCWDTQLPWIAFARGEFIG
ncbi:fungal-specific transcription factor domain-containing protein [Aspergillus unguis]